MSQLCASWLRLFSLDLANLGPEEFAMQLAMLLLLPQGRSECTHTQQIYYIVSRTDAFHCYYDVQLVSQVPPCHGGCKVTML